MKRIIAIGLFLSLLLTAALLFSGNGGSDSNDSTLNSYISAPQGAGSTENDIITVGYGADTTSTTRQQTQERLIIQDASLELLVDDPARSLDAFRSQTTSTWEGWVVSANLYGSGDSRRATLTIRVPAAQFDTVLAELKAAALEVRSESITGKDVTDTYTDLDSQLRNLEAAETELQRIMEDATTTQDVLAVYNQLTAIRGSIETIQGQMQYYEQSAAYSSVSMTLWQERKTKPVTKDKKVWRPLETAKDAIETLVVILQGVGDVVIVLMIVGLPLLLLFGLPTWWARRLWLKQKKA